MFGNIIKIALRSLRKNKAYSFINISGLAIGLAGFILITTYIKSELSFDTFQEDRNLVYRLVEIQNPPGIEPINVATTMGPLAPTIANDFPEIESSVRIFRTGTMRMRIDDQIHFENRWVYADETVFDILSVKPISGDLKAELQKPHTIVLTQSAAEKYFDGQNAVGKTISINSFGDDQVFEVVGLVEDYPENSHLEFNMIASMATIRSLSPERLERWTSNWLTSYIKVAPGTNIEQLHDKIPAFLDTHMPESQFFRKAGALNFEVYLQPLSEIHLQSDHIRYQPYNFKQSSLSNVYMFTIISVLILLVACINFMNLSTARSAKRAKEVGIRKVLGTERKNLIYQFLGESTIVTFMGLILGLVLTQLAFPYFQSYMGGIIKVGVFESGTLVWELIGIVLVVGILAGSYPAFFLSSFKPTETLKGAFTTSSKGALLRKTLVVSQFSVAIALLITTGIVTDQMRYIQNTDLGYDQEQLIHIPLRSADLRNRIPFIKNELQRNTNIVAVTAANSTYGGGQGDMTVTVANTQDNTSLLARNSSVDFSYLETLGMDIVDGRGFSEDYASDTTNAIIINQSLAETLGWEDPVGKEFNSFSGPEGPKMTVVGVIKDFHYFTLHLPVEPLVMRVRKRGLNNLFIKTSVANTPETLAYIEQTLQTIAPEIPFQYNFMDDLNASRYESDQNQGYLFASFSGLAIIVALLGLFGLAAFTAEQKTKEIGVRKVLGATVPNITGMLSIQFIKWVAIASVIAFPVAYLVGTYWLNNFEFQTQISPFTFAMATLVVLAISLLTVSFHAIKAALMNPVKALRYE